MDGARGRAGAQYIVSTRQERIGHRVAWGKWCYEELEKERSGEEKSSWKGEQFPSAVDKAALF